MKILMINSVCGIRSTGRICTDLACALEEQGHEVKIAYGRENVPKQYKKYAVRIGNDIDVYCHAIKARIFDADGLGSKCATKNFLKWVIEYNPDIIHLHNLHGYYINVPLLFEYIIKSKKKVLWTFHDTWGFTGHSCTCDLHKCEKWKIGCGECPAYKEYPASIRDRSSNNYIWKKNLFSKVEHLIIITPSKWLGNLVKQSFLGDKRIEVIPNGIDTKQFKPLENDFKSFYGLEGKILLMGCATWWGESKGLFDFYKLSKQLNDCFKIVLVGLNRKQIANIPENILGIERTNNVKELAKIYSAADVFLNLTYADNYPTVNLEALACGTPVITYRTGGSAECLDGKNGLSFYQGDIEGIAEFFNIKYKSGIFEVKNHRQINKDNSIQSYLSIIKELN